MSSAGQRIPDDIGVKLIGIMGILAEAGGQEKGYGGNKVKEISRSCFSSCILQLAKILVLSDSFLSFLVQLPWHLFLFNLPHEALRDHRQTMGLASLSPRSSTGGLGLGWLLAFSLGGAILLFTCVGLLLSWRIKPRPENIMMPTTTVYEVTDRDDGGTVGVGGGSGGGNSGSERSRLKKKGLGFGRRLTRRKYVMARSTSRLSLSPSSLLPPMPTYQGFSFFGQGGRKKSRSWVEEDRFHGPRMNRRSLRNSWLFGRDSWRGRTPTLPAVGFEEPEEDDVDDDVEKGMRGGGGGGGGESLEGGLTGLHIPRTASPEEMGVPVMATTALPPPPRPPVPAPLELQQQPQSQLQPQPQPHAEPQQDQQPQPQQYQQPHPQQYQQMTGMELIFVPQELPLTETTATRPPRIPAQLLTRLAMADPDLNDILRSTEQRLKEGRHRSPDKTTPPPTTTTIIPETATTTTPTTSPTKASPVKTPHSHRTASSQGSIGSVGTVRVARLSTSPSKRATICTIPQSTQHSRNASISSMGSTAAAAAAATAAQGPRSEAATPSNTRGRIVAWQLPKPDVEPVIDLSAALHIRSQSIESDESSTLSTVYSVGEQEDKTTVARGPPKDTKKNPYDPFVGPPPAAAATGLPAKSRLFGPRSPRKLSISEPAPAGLPSLRQTARRPQTVGGHAMFSIVLDPPTDNNNLFEMDYFNAIGKDGIALAYPISPSTGSPSLSEPSVTSMVTASVTTARDSDGDSDTVGPLEDERLTRDRPETQASPTKRNSVVTICRASPVKTTVSSAHYDERDLISLAPSNFPQRRALPEPPRHFGHIDESTMPAPISPRPRRDFSQQLREMSVNSNLHDEEPAPEDPSAVSTGSPHRRPNLRSARSPPLSAVMAVGSSVAELRRMNSMVSTCSVASVASSTCNDESPTVPGLRGAGYSPTRSSARASNIGQHHYLSLGTPSKRESGPGRSLPSDARISRVNPAGDDLGEGNGHGREMNSVDFRVRRVDASLLAAPRSSDDTGIRTAPRVMSNRDSMDELEVIEPSGLDRRIIRDSLGMYDKKGFVRSSVRREMMRR